MHCFTYWQKNFQRNIGKGNTYSE